MVSTPLPPPPPPPPPHTHTHTHTHTHIHTAQLLLESQQYAQVTPLQVSLMFQLCSMEHASTGTISLHDFSKLLPPSRPYSMVGRYPPQGGKENDVPAPSDSDVQVMGVVYGWVKGGMFAIIIFMLGKG